MINDGHVSQIHLHIWIVVKSKMAVVVWVKRHPLSKGLNVWVEFEVGVAFDALCAEFSCPISCRLRNLMDLEDTRIFIEQSIQKPA